jgi:pimeloyl-ACP methyl ester carboxylesterase
VHGAWHGSWCWARVRRALVAQGHDVFTPTLTGVGERSHLLARDIDLQVHIDDVSNLIRWEALDEVILCGHSYGGCVISGAADALPDRIAALVYLDAFLLEEGVDIRYVQRLLGHRSISTTEIYTQVADAALKVRITEKHPRRTIVG